MNETRLKIIIFCLVAIIALLVIPNISAANEALTFKQHEIVDIKLPCSYKGANCNITAAAGCNLTVIYPNGTFMFENQPMTLGVGTGIANYTLPNTFALGDHPYKQSCYESELFGEDTGVITITSTGTEGNNNLILIFFGVFAVLLLVIGYAMEIPTMGFFAGIMFLLSGMFVLIYGFGSINDWYTQAFGVVAIALGIIISMAAAFTWMPE